MIFATAMRNFCFLFWALLALLACRTNQAVDPPAVQKYYTEQHRPQYHFSPEAMWMNDPNGMVYYEGEYHLFYQHYPDSNVWGPMHWGHAVSTDLVNWEHLPIALYPDGLGLIFSGSAVIDWNNTSGLAPEGQVPMVAIFTHHNMEEEKAGRNDYQVQSIAFSLDRGRTWTKYQDNPVIPNPGIRDFRDPKVFWHQASSSWVMIFARGDRVQIHRSPNLIDWTLASEFGEDQGSHGGVWECPDLFPLPVEESGAEKWVMIVSLGSGGPNGGSGTMYFTGDFDGTTFTNDNPKETVLWLDYGKDNYAGVTWSDIPQEDGRRIFMGWMSNWQYATRVPTYDWRSAMTLARSLHLVSTDEGIRMQQKPVVEQNQLRGPAQNLPATVVSGEKVIAPNSSGQTELDLLFTLSEETPANSIGLSLANAKGEKVFLGYDVKQKQYFVDRRQAGIVDFAAEFPGRHTAPAQEASQQIRMRLYLDHNSVELFAEEGRTVMTELFFPTELLTQLSVFAEGGAVELSEGTIYPLERIW
jgi:fructan beta-fructosidase